MTVNIRTGEQYTVIYTEKSQQNSTKKIQLAYTQLHTLERCSLLS